MSCTEKHTKFQPGKEHWKCPDCGKGCAGGIGFLIEGGPNPECDLLHENDETRCAFCGYQESGYATALKMKRKARVKVCPTCKGTGPHSERPETGGMMWWNKKAELKSAEQVSGESVRAIFEDLRGRRTLKDLFDEGDAYDKITDEVQIEIFEKWKDLIKKQVKRAGVP